MQMKKTIKVQVLESADILKQMTTHTDLRNWAIENQMNNRSAFPKFKAALLEIGINYDLLKTDLLTQERDHNSTVQDSVVVEKSMIEKIAEKIYGKVWQKNDKNRIYVEGGNNYHYNGSWYIEFEDDTCLVYEAKCFLKEGYNIIIERSM